MHKICLAFWQSEPQSAYKRYAYKNNMYIFRSSAIDIVVYGACRRNFKSNGTR